MRKYEDNYCILLNWCQPKDKYMKRERQNAVALSNKIMKKDVMEQNMLMNKLVPR